MKRTLLSILSVAALVVLTVRPASATFHLMQIEQVIGGVDGNTGVQAIQLRMRSTRGPARRAALPMGHRRR